MERAAWNKQEFVSVIRFFKVYRIFQYDYMVRAYFDPHAAHISLWMDYNVVDDERFWV